MILTDGDKKWLQSGGEDEFKIVNADCIQVLAEMPWQCADLVIFSPPFAQLYSYTNHDEDLGNSENYSGDAKIHLSFFYRQMARIVKPGRVVCVHVQQVPRMKRVNKRGGLIDFRGLNIRLAERAGLIYEYDWVIRKNPQAQAIRTKSRELQFSGLERDRARSRGALCDYILKFCAEGDNQEAVDSEGEVIRNEWIDLAEGTWQVRETDTLNVKGTKGPEDVKHVCPLQLPLIDRLVRLFSNPGNIVVSPFAGIGSEIYSALKLNRRGFGIELKKEYFEEAVKNCEKAIRNREAAKQGMLFQEMA